MNQIEPDPRLLEALASLNAIGGAINRIGSREDVGIEVALRLIVQSAITVVPDASAVIYTYDPAARRFVAGSRVSAGPVIDSGDVSGPRPEGLGMRAIAQGRRVISYEEDDLQIPSLAAPFGPKVVVCSPLIVAEQAVGALYVYLHEERPFSRLELLMLDNFVNQAAMAIYHAQRLSSMHRDLARTEDELVSLRRAGLLISARPRLKETLDAILQMALEMTNARYGIFRLLDKESKRLVTQAVAGDLARPLVEDLPLDVNSVMGHVARERQPLRIADLRTEPWCEIYYPLDSDLEMRSELAVPLINASGRLEGVLNLESPVVAAFTEQHSHLLQALASHAIIAIQEVRLLDALQDVAERLLTQPRQDVLDHLVELACDLLNASAGAIWIVSGDRLVLQAASAAHPRDGRLSIHDSLAGQAVLTRQPVTASDVREDPRFSRRETAREHEWNRALVVPILAGSENRAVGAFSVYGAGSEPSRFAESEWDTKVLVFLARHAALAWENAARLDALRRAQEEHAVAETFAAVGDVAANLLHQLNNKVGAIPVRVQGIQDKCAAVLAADSYLASNLAEIERSATEAMEAVRDHLFHLRPIELLPVSVERCVKTALTSARLGDGVAVETVGLGDLPRAFGAEQTLMLVFVNLLENAAEAAGGVCRIQITGHQDDAWVGIDVADDGPGIPVELQESIFEFSFSGRRSGRPGKLGFGLWWVKTLLARLGGSIAVNSDGQRGTVFRLRLPRAERQT